jgi:hypothetical protein
MNKKKILIGGIIIGTLCVFIIPSSECPSIGDTVCSILPIIGYGAYAVSGLIIAYEILKILKECCSCCC